MQPGHAMRLIGGHPCGYGIAVRILDCKGGAGQFLVVGKVTFAYPHFRRLVGTGVIQHHNSLSIIGESDFHRLLVDVIAERGAEFLDDVITAVGGGVLADAAAVILAANRNNSVNRILYASFILLALGETVYNANTALIPCLCKQGQR